MKTTKRLRDYLNGDRIGKLPPEDEAELYRVRRRLEKFPRFNQAPNPHAHRLALFKSRYGLMPEPPIIEFRKVESPTE